MYSARELLRLVDARSLGAILCAELKYSGEALDDFCRGRKGPGEFLRRHQGVVTVLDEMDRRCMLLADRPVSK